MLAVGFAADARMHDDDRTAKDDRKQRKHAGSERADARARAGHDGDDQSHGQGAQRNIEAVCARMRRGPVLPRKRQLSGMVTAKTTTFSAIAESGVQATSRSAAATANQPIPAPAEADQEPVTLGEHRIDRGEDGDGAVDGNAADGAGGNEIRRMVERKDDVGGRRRGRQRPDQAADERTRSARPPARR